MSSYKLEWQTVVGSQLIAKLALRKRREMIDKGGTSMAKPKRKIVIGVHKSEVVPGMSIYIANPEDHMRDVSSVEGVLTVSLFSSRNSLMVTTDPRYDVSEIAQEIEELLTAEVPDVFLTISPD